MKLLIDMNLSPEWVDVLRSNGYEAQHWSTVGDPRAPDYVIMEWARATGSIVLTHDLDFGALLAITSAVGPSVIQVRTKMSHLAIWKGSLLPRSVSIVRCLRQGH